MYLLAKFGGHRSYGNEDINSYINCYMNTSEKPELTSSIRHIERLSQLGTSIYCSEVLGNADRKTTKRKQTIARRSAFHAKAISSVVFRVSLKTYVVKLKRFQFNIILLTYLTSFKYYIYQSYCITLMNDSVTSFFFYINEFYTVQRKLQSPISFVQVTGKKTTQKLTTKK